MTKPEIVAPSGHARRRELLNRLLDGRLSTSATRPRRIPRGGPVPLSYPQERLWFLDQLRPGATEYVAPWMWQLRGALDVGALHAAWRAVVARHEILRTRYHDDDGDPVQVVDDHVELTLPVTDLSGLPADEREGALAGHVQRHLDTPFDLGGELPFRLRLVRFGEDDHLLLLAVHHIAFDGWSVGILVRELGELYAAHVRGTEPALPPLPLRYADFAAWQRERGSAEWMSGQLGYWRAHLAGVAPVEIPTDRARPATYDTRGARVTFTVAAPLGVALRGLGRAHRATPFMVYLAAFQTLLARYSGQTDICVGSPTSGRTEPDVQGLLGLFVNTVVLRCDLSGSPSFVDLLGQVRDNALAAYANQDLPFERLVHELAPARDLSRNPLFSHLFALQDNESADFTSADVRARALEVPTRTAKFDLTLQLTEQPDGSFDGVLEYATALFDRPTVERMAGHFLALLDSAVTSPNTAVDDLAVLPAGERRHLVEHWNRTGAAVPPLTVTELFRRTVLSTPDSPAVSSGGRTLSYAQLDAQVNQLAHHLRALGVGRGTLVGVHLERGVDLVVALLAVLNAGGAYLPLDPGYPAARIAFLLADSGAGIVITEQSRAGDVTAAPTVIVLDRDGDRIATHPEHAPARVCGPHDLAYMIYTSGSTGTPKGVMVHHHALTNFLLSMRDRPGLSAEDTAIALTTVSFDISALELYLPLVVGAHVVVADTVEARDPERMVSLIATTKPTILQATPVYFRMLLDAGWSAPAGLTVLCGGERLPADLAVRLVAGGASVWDVYGPTEATVWASAARLDGHGAVADWAPLANYTVHVLDGGLEPVPLRVAGELYLGGDGVARGYHGRPALTAERFVPDPHSGSGGRLYRTGDLARRHPDGSVEILGRADRQVKIRGHRIEPGEIETALLAHDDLGAAVVTANPTRSGDHQLTGYVVPRGQRVPTANELRRFLLTTLPDHLVPAVFVPLERLPLTPNGKVDHRALPAPEPVRATSGAESRVEPRTHAERVVARVWRDVLNLPSVGTEDHFFAIGGNSLLATKVTVRLRAALDVDVPVRALFDHSTVAALAGALDGYPPLSERPVAPVLTARRRGRSR